jgi:hypothetical protein
VARLFFHIFLRHALTPIVQAERKPTIETATQRQRQRLDAIMKSAVVCLVLLAATARAFVASPPASTHHAKRMPSSLRMYESVEAAIAEAQKICANDPSSPECRVAWDIVEELEAADSHTTAAPYAAANDDAMVSALLGSFDILLSKIDGKMDQLMATTQRLEEFGTADPSIAALGQRAAEMKYALANAKASLGRH